MKRGVVMMAVLVTGSLAISSCGSPEGISISSGTLNSYRPPPGEGILCGGSGEYVFLTFAITKGIVSGHIVETNVSTRAELPMNGSSKGHKVTFLPLDGFGEFKGTLDGHSLDLSSVEGESDGPTDPIQCSLVSVAKWRAAAASATQFTSRQLSTPEFLALSDLIYAMNNADGASGTGTGPFATPASTLAQSLSAQEDRAVRGNAPPGYTVGNRVPDPRLAFTSGPVSRPNDVSVDVSTSGYVLALACGFRSIPYTCSERIRTPVPMFSDTPGGP